MNFGVLKRRGIGPALVIVLTLGSSTVMAQGMGAPPAEVPGFKQAPGFYGTSFGVPSYGTIRTYSEFSSPYGGGYGYGYRPSYTILPGRYGVGIWQPGSTYAAYGYRADSYRTFPIPYQKFPTRPVVTPPFGVYAPAFGPSTGSGW